MPQLEKPTLNGITATVPSPAELEYATGVDMDIRFSRTAEEEPYRAWLVSLTIDPGYHDSLQQWDINDACLEWNGPGYYSVRFRLLSKDITRYNDGPWSEWSEPSNVTEIQTELRRQLQQIAGNADGMSNDEIRASVQELNSYSLKAAMVTDQDNSGPVAAMAALDEKLGGTPITVAPEMNGSFGADEISVVGAQLNTPQAAGKPIGFVLEKPKYNDVVPAMYNSSIAVRFSMDLENTNTGGMLAVPVKVTLPIPAGINPAFLAVLHYHTAGGEPEAIHPYVFQENGKYYASFVLSSFSDFIFTETLNDSDEAVAGFVRRGYSLILGRGADEGGLNYWMNQLKSGQLTGAGFVKGFLDSDEFRAKGASDTEVISIFYRVMMDREPDAGGMAYWMSILDKGVSYAYIINGFAASDEFGDICAASGITPGSVPLTEARDQNAQVTAFVNRNYLYALQRKGEPDGLNYWAGELLNKTKTPQQAADEFVFSKECINRGLNDRDFVEMLYHLYMGRDPDEGGLQYWISELDAGKPREEAAAGFARSQEFKDIVISYGLPVWDPDIVFSTTDMFGKQYTDSIFADADVTMLNLWAYWCPPCIGELKDLQKLQDNYAKRGFQVFGVSEGSWNEQNIKEFQRQGIKYPSLILTESLDRALYTGSIPTTIFVDREGRILCSEPYIGARSYNVWARIVESYLG